MNRPLESLTEFVHDAAESMLGERFNRVELGTDIITEVADRVHQVDAPPTPVAMGRLAADSQAEQPARVQEDVSSTVATDVVDTLRQNVELAHTNPELITQTPQVANSQSTDTQVEITSAQLEDARLLVDAVFDEAGITQDVFQGVGHDSETV